MRVPTTRPAFLPSPVLSWPGPLNMIIISQYCSFVDRKLEFHLHTRPLVLHVYIVEESASATLCLKS